MKVIETLWFNGFKGSVGIVVIEEDVTKKRKAYIGVASGKDEKLDTDGIISWGQRFSLDTAKKLVYLLGGKT